MSSATEIDTPDIDVTVTQEHLQDDLFKIYSQLFKDIKREEVCFEELQGKILRFTFLTVD